MTAAKRRYETLVLNLYLSLIRARQDMYNRAEANSIREKAIRREGTSLKSLFAGLDYEVEFITWAHQMEVR